jgi:hypothetical protein
VSRSQCQWSVLAEQGPVLESQNAFASDQSEAERKNQSKTLAYELGRGLSVKEEIGNAVEIEIERNCVCDDNEE